MYLCTMVLLKRVIKPMAKIENKPKITEKQGNYEKRRIENRVSSRKRGARACYLQRVQRAHSTAGSDVDGRQRTSDEEVRHPCQIDHLVYSEPGGAAAQRAVEAINCVD